MQGPLPGGPQPALVISLSVPTHHPPDPVPESSPAASRLILVTLGRREPVTVGEGRASPQNPRDPVGPSCSGWPRKGELPLWLRCLCGKGPLRGRALESQRLTHSEVRRDPRCAPCCVVRASHGAL